MSATHPVPSCVDDHAEIETKPQAMFDWPLCYEAQTQMGGFIEAFLARNALPRRLTERMAEEPGTEFFRRE